MLHLKPGRKVFVDSIGEDGEFIEPEDILSWVFTEPVEDIEGWTLLDLIEYIKPYGQFFGEMAKCNYEAFYEEINKPAPPQDKDDYTQKIQYILVSRIAEFQNKEETEITEYFNVNGKNDDETDEYGNYAIEFTPVSLLANKPIKINDTFELRRSMHKDRSMPVIFSYKKPLYFLDIIWAILWEISFLGLPEKRDKEKEKLDRVVYNINSGKGQLVPVEEALLRLRSTLENDATEQGSKGAD